MTARAVHIIDAACDADAVLEATLLADGEPLLCAGAAPEWASEKGVLPLTSPRGRVEPLVAALRAGATARCWSISSARRVVELNGKPSSPVAVRIASPPSPHQVSQLVELGRQARLLAVCANRALAASLEGTGLAEAVRVVPPPAVGEAPNRLDAREKLGLGSEEFVVAACGGVHARSGHRFAVWAAAVLSVAEAPIRLVVPHTGQAARDVARFAAEAGFSKQMLLVQRRNAAELAEILAAADVALLLNADALPLVPLASAMRAGLPIVASDIPGAAAHLEDGRTALLVRPDTPRVISRALLRLYEDRKLARRLGRAAKAAADDRFDITAVRRQWYDLR